LAGSAIFIPIVKRILSPAKINVGLRVSPKRSDGFHSLQTIFFKISLYDEILIEEADQLSLSCSDPTLPTNENNLILKAYQRYYSDHSHPPVFKIQLEKKIPFGAGVGGGSSNAAEMLKYFHQKEQPGKPIGEKLMQTALELGSDVPFFLYSSPCYAEGRGEILKPLEPVPSLPILLAGTGTSISTPEVFHLFDATNPIPLRSFPLSEVHGQLSARREAELQNLVINDLQPVVESEWPEMCRVRELLQASGAHFVSMSGSGFLYYGIYPSVQIRDRALQSIGNQLPFVKPAWTIA